MDRKRGKTGCRDATIFEYEKHSTRIRSIKILCSLPYCAETCGTPIERSEIVKQKLMHKIYVSNSGPDPFQCPLSESRHSAPGGDHERDRRVRERSLRSDDALGCFRCLEAPEQQPEGEQDDLEHGDGKGKDPHWP